MFPIQPDASMRVCAGTSHGSSTGVISVNEDERKDTDFCHWVRGSHLGLGGPVDDVGALEGDISLELVEEVLLRREAAVWFANAGGAKDDHVGESFAGDKVKGGIEGLEDDLVVLADQIHWWLT